MLASAYNLSKKIASLRETIFYLALKNIKSRYAGTFGGIFWAFLTPLSTVLVYWFIFGVGFKLQSTQGTPFIVVFLCGFLPWLFFSEALSANIQTISTNSHLVKKTLFPTEILPICNLLSGIIPHLFLLIILVIIIQLNGIPLSLKNLSLFYYLSGLTLFSLGLGWIVAALNVFYRDIGQTVSIFLNVWFWLTPITWFMNIFPEKWHFLIKLNPLYWVVEGYRSALIPNYSTNTSLALDGYFWILCLMILLCGASIFKSLKFEFPDAF